MVGGFQQGLPLGAGQVRRGDDARPLDEFGEGCRRRFQAQFNVARFEAGSSEHFHSDREDEVLFPLHVLGHVRLGGAKGAKLIVACMTGECTVLTGSCCGGPLGCIKEGQCFSPDILQITFPEPELVPVGA